MAINKLLPFANGDASNLIDFELWNSLPARTSGFRSGIASSSQFNRILAQGGAAGYVIGQMVADHTTQNADIQCTALYENFKKAIAAFIPTGVVDNGIDGKKLKNNSVAFDKLIKEQLLNGLEKNFVRFDKQQTIGDKSQVLANIDAQSAEELQTALKELITEFGGDVPV